MTHEMSQWIFVTKIKKKIILKWITATFSSLSLLCAHLFFQRQFFPKAKSSITYSFVKKRRSLSNGGDSIVKNLINQDCSYEKNIFLLYVSNIVQVKVSLNLTAIIVVPKILRLLGFLIIPFIKYSETYKINFMERNIDLIERSS